MTLGHRANRIYRFTIYLKNTKSVSTTRAHITMEHAVMSSIWERYEVLRLWAYPERISLKLIEEARHAWI